MKRCFDILVSAAALTVCGPIILIAAAAVRSHDGGPAFYVSRRVGRHGRPLRFFKLRTMIPDADKTGVDTTIAGDQRITPVGRMLRATRIDELPQFYHVLRGDMSLVGPRPNVPREVALYTAEEQRMLQVRPGITDLASIVFSDLGEILANSDNPNRDYNRLIRPWKSRLALFYVDRASVWLDVGILTLTAILFGSRRLALRGVVRLLARHGADPALVAVAGRREPLRPWPPPGSSRIADNRD